MRAGKGGAVVLMDTAEYKIKAYRLLDDENTYDKLYSVPTVTTIQSKFNNAVRKIARDIPNPDQKNMVLSKI